MSIGLALTRYPRMVRVPGHPVYCAPELPANYFFYDGLYWVFEGNDWYASSWYNGPWDRVRHGCMPAEMLQLPVSCYRRPPPCFRGWAVYAPPHWGERWGPRWALERPDWDHRDRASPRDAAPLPGYQQRYPSDRYPDRPQQQLLQGRFYDFQSGDALVCAVAHELPAAHQRASPDPLS